jgi:hypothetical protein
MVRFVTLLAMSYSAFVVAKRAGNRMATTEQDNCDILRCKMMRY